jgi:hypothetical protein
MIMKVESAKCAEKDLGLRLLVQGFTAKSAYILALEGPVWATAKKRQLVDERSLACPRSWEIVATLDLGHVQIWFFMAK